MFKLAGFFFFINLRSFRVQVAKTSLNIYKDFFFKKSPHPLIIRWNKYFVTGDKLILFWLSTEQLIFIVFFVQLVMLLQR